MSQAMGDTAMVPLFHPGMRLDRYELLCPLAQGGMGAVWLARYAGKFGFARLVVVKLMLPQYAQDENMRAMFIDEARIAASIDHPNVVATIDVGEEDGLLFLVMNWVDGDSLSRLVKQVTQNRERVLAGVVLKIAADVCAGLHAAHEQRDPSGELRGVVHRDVSPQNILLATNGRAMLIDFGIAKANKRIAEETAIGRAKGKLSYMSPEQARTDKVDRRADIFSVGAVLYELFAGFPPFERENDVQTLTRLTRGGPATPLPKGTPPAVQSVVMRALALDPGARYQTAADLGDAIVVAMHEIGAPTTDNEVARYADEYLSVRRGAASARGASGDVLARRHDDARGPRRNDERECDDGARRIAFCLRARPVCARRREQNQCGDVTRARHRAGIRRAGEQCDGHGRFARCAFVWRGVAAVRRRDFPVRCGRATRGPARTRSSRLAVAHTRRTTEAPLDVDSDGFDLRVGPAPRRAGRGEAESRFGRRPHTQRRAAAASDDGDSAFAEPTSGRPSIARQRLGARRVHRHRDARSHVDSIAALSSANHGKHRSNRDDDLVQHSRAHVAQKAFETKRNE